VSIAAYTIVLGIIWLNRTGTHVLAGVARTAGRALLPAVIAGGSAWWIAYALQDVADGFVGALLQLMAGGVAAAGSFVLLAGWMGTTKPISED
jgi:hypothetical protein